MSTDSPKHAQVSSHAYRTPGRCGCVLATDGACHRCPCGRCTSQLRQDGDRSSRRSTSERTSPAVSSTPGSTTTRACRRRCSPTSSSRRLTSSSAWARARTAPRRRARSRPSSALLHRRPARPGRASAATSTRRWPCTLAAAKLGVPVAHVEAGLRSFDWTMPEEINRVLTDRMAELLFTHSPEAAGNLAAEGIDEQRIHFVGNTMIDSLRRFEGRAEERRPWTRASVDRGDLRAGHAAPPVQRRRTRAAAARSSRRSSSSPHARR